MCSSRLYHPLALLGVQIGYMISRGSVALRLHPCLSSDVPDGTPNSAHLRLDKLGFSELNNWIPSNYTNAYNVFSLHLTCNQNHLRFSQVVFLFTRCRKAAH